MTEVVGIGSCPKRAEGLGHVWLSPYVDEYRSCEFCGTHGREPAKNFDLTGAKPNQGGGYFAQATMARVNFFDTLRPPASANGTPVKRP